MKTQTFKKSGLRYITETNDLFISIEKGMISDIPRPKQGWQILIINTKTKKRYGYEAETLREAKHRASILISDHARHPQF